MADLLEAVSLVHEALSPLEPADRRRVLASVGALLEDNAETAARWREFEKADSQLRAEPPEGYIPPRRIQVRPDPKARPRRGRHPSVLVAITTTPGLSLSALSRALGQNPSTTHGRVAKLIRRGKVRTERKGRSRLLYPLGQTSGGAPATCEGAE